MSGANLKKLLKILLPGPRRKYMRARDLEVFGKFSAGRTVRISNEMLDEDAAINHFDVEKADTPLADFPVPVTAATEGQGKTQLSTSAANGAGTNEEIGEAEIAELKSQVIRRLTANALDDPEAHLNYIRSKLENI